MNLYLIKDNGELEKVGSTPRSEISAPYGKAELKIIDGETYFISERVATPIKDILEYKLGKIEWVA